MTQFIYQPTTGSRIFAESPTPFILKFRWRNGSCHVVGGVHLVLRPGGSRTGRGVATALVTQVVQKHGGVGWDEQGCIEAIVPPRAALALDRLCRSLEAAGGLLGQKLDLADLAAQMFIQGLATVAEEGHFEPVCWAEDGPAVEVTRASWEPHDEGGRRLVIETTAGTVKVPSSWVGLLETSGPWGSALLLAGSGSSGDPPDDDISLASVGGEEHDQGGLTSVGGDEPAALDGMDI